MYKSDLIKQLTDAKDNIKHTKCKLTLSYVGIIGSNTGWYLLDKGRVGTFNIPVLHSCVHNLCNKLCTV